MSVTDQLRLSVGDEVVVTSGAHSQRAIVVEDRGKIGIGGIRVWRIRLLPHESGEEPIEFELAENLLSILPHG